MDNTLKELRELTEDIKENYVMVDKETWNDFTEQVVLNAMEIDKLRKVVNGIFRDIRPFMVR